MEPLEQLRRHLPPLAVDVVRLCAWLALLAAIFVPLERLCALHAQRVFRKAFLTDLAYYFLNSLVPKLLLILPLSAIAWGLHHLAPGGLYAAVASLPPGVRFAAALVVGEVGAYWGHRWMHEIPALWRLHAIHHSAEEMDWLVNTRAHPLDVAFTRLCGLVPIYVLGLAQPGARSVDLVPLLYALVGTTWSFFVHTNVRWRFGQLEWLISTPAFHHWHHTNDGPAYTNRNYAAIFPWVDRLFGTLHLPKDRWPTRYGIDAPIAPGLAEQLLQPLLGARADRSTAAQRDPPSPRD
jgi:sterol desaturase/sphingolipid hydroxylase (fatty acid hydroxylase superfamily)